MAHSLAVFRLLTRDGGVDLKKAANFVAVHSLGEYSALCAAGSFDLATTANLLRLRGRAMQQAVPVGVGAMAALLGADLALAQRIADAASEGEVCTVANDNDPSQVVISGHKGAIDRAIEIAKDMGAKRAVPLPVSAPFHCPLMQARGRSHGRRARLCRARTARGAARRQRHRRADQRSRHHPQPAGRTGHRNGPLARKRRQHGGPGVEEFVELGGKVLGPMVKRIVPDTKVTSCGDGRGRGSAGEGDRVMFDLSGMTALVTGASGGLGSAIAKALAGQGARLAVSGSNVDKLEAFRSSLGGDHVALPCNLSDGAAVDALVPQAVEALGQLDILVNNAGVTRDNLLMRMKDEEFTDVIKVNLEAAFRLIRAAAKPMMKARFGRIISVSSVVGVTGNPGQANYVASKAGLIGLTKSVAQELASRGITANAVAPGFMASAMTDALNEKQRDAILSKIPLGAMGSGADIGAAVVYLASKEAGYVTGQTIHVNGGMAMP
jgi:3-oxoacyl-(acyl-carrier-protein) reductase